MQRIADWLEKLGLGQYAQRFAENDINFAILPDLTDQDLKELGVASLGHRRQLLRGITELKGGDTATRNPAVEPFAPPAQTSTPIQDAALLPKCFRCQTMGDIRRSAWPRKSAGRERRKL